MTNIRLSSLGHTWIIDLDGTILKHNGYLIDGVDTLLNGAIDFLSSIPKDDLVIFITARKSSYKDATIKFLKDNNVRFNHIIFDAPHGERIVINDMKSFNTAIAINKIRDSDIDYIIDIDKNL